MRRIENVILRRLTLSGTWKPLESQRNSAVARTRTPANYRSRDLRRDKLIGDRGEELVYRSERERVAQLGYSADRVVWVSKNDPLADHDIRSVDNDGQDIWIEVKSTTGKDGRFEWSQAGFELALQVRERYLISRVYEVETDHASVKCFRDPVALLLANTMNIDIALLHVQVEPLSA